MQAKDFQIIYDETRRAVARALSAVHIQEWRTCDGCNDAKNNNGEWYCASSPNKARGQNCDVQSKDKDYIMSCNKKKEDECEALSDKCDADLDVCDLCEKKVDAGLTECSWLSENGLVIQWSQIQVETIGSIDVKDDLKAREGLGLSKRCQLVDPDTSSDDEGVKETDVAEDGIVKENECSTAIKNLRARVSDQAGECRAMGSECEWVPRITAIQLVISNIPEDEMKLINSDYTGLKGKEWKTRVVDRIKKNKADFKATVKEFVTDQLEITGKYEGALDQKMIHIHRLEVDKWDDFIYPLTNLAIADNQDKDEGRDVIYVSLGVMGGLMCCICSIALLRQFTNVCHYDNCCFRAVRMNEEGKYMSHGMTLTRSMTTKYDHPSMWMEESNKDGDTLNDQQISDIMDQFRGDVKSGEWEKKAPNRCMRCLRAMAGKKNTFNRGLYIQAQEEKCGPTEKFRQNTLYSDPEGTSRSSFMTGRLSVGKNAFAQLRALSKQISASGQGKNAGKVELAAMGIKDKDDIESQGKSKSKKDAMPGATD